MPERRAQIMASPAYRSGTVAARQVVVEELPDHVLVDVTDVQWALAHPARKVGNAAEVSSDGLECVAALGQVMRERINVRRQLALMKPIRRSTVKLPRRVHHGLLKWGDVTLENRKNYV